MKKYLCTALALVMAAALFVGCGCTNRNVSDHPGGIITDPTGNTTNPMPTMTTPTEVTTMPTTLPTTEATMPSTGLPNGTEGIGSMDGTDGTGILPDASQPMPGTTGAPDGTTDNARSSRRWPDRES